MKKKIIAVMLAILAFFSFAPTTIFAASAPISSCVDLISLDNDKFGTGYKWDNLDCILTLDNLNIDTTDDFGIKLPAGNSDEGATVILNGKNTIKASSCGIQALGKLTFKGDGSLTIISEENGIIGASLKNTHTVTFRSGSITITAPKNGIYTETSDIVFSGATVKITSDENAVYGKNIKAVSGTLDFKGKIKAKGTFSLSNTNLTAVSSDKALEANGGVSFKDAELKTGATLSSLTSVSEYNGEKAIQTVGTKQEKSYGFLFGGKFPAYMDYVFISVIILAIIAVIAVPLTIKYKKTQKLIAENETKKRQKKQVRIKK